jgi:hypothetical protein
MKKEKDKKNNQINQSNDKINKPILFINDLKEIFKNKYMTSYNESKKS